MCAYCVPVTAIICLHVCCALPDCAVCVRYSGGTAVYPYLIIVLAIAVIILL